MPWDRFRAERWAVRCSRGPRTVGLVSDPRVGLPPTAERQNNPQLELGHPSQQDTDG